MYAVGRLSSYISTVSGPFHPFGGAVDIIVVQQPDGSFKSSPWYVKFGKFQGVLKTKEKVVNISVNGVEAGFHMYLNHKGEAYFLKELDGEEEDSVFSPPSSCDETDHPSRSERITKFKSFDVDIDANQSSQETRIDVSNGKIVSRTNSRRSRIFGLVFGRKSMKEDGIGAERVTSLERAELAADLLEVKWSTNLPTSKPGTMPVKEADKDLQIDDEQSLGSRLVPDSIGNSYDLPVIHVESDLCDNSGSDFGNTESSDKEIMEKVPCLGTQEQVMEISASDEEDRREVIYEVCSVSEITVTDLSNPDIVELEVGCSTESGTETDVILSSSGNERDCSFIYRETAEISRVRTDDSFEQAIETMDFYHGGCEEVQPHGEVLYQTAELISEVNPQPESEVLATIENLNGTGYPRNGDSSDFLVTKTISESEGTSVNSATSIVKESLLSLDLQFVTSNSVTTEMLEVNHQDTLTEYLAQNKILETEPVEVFENQSQITDFSYSHISEGNKVSIGQPSKALVSHIQVVGVDQILGSVEEGELPSISTASRLSNSVHRVQVEENLGKENKMNKLCPSQEFLCDPQESGFDSLCVKEIKTNVSTSESLEEDQFLFSDIDDLVPSRVQCKDSICLESRETENHGSLTLEGIEDEHERGNVDPESSSFQDKLIEEYPASDFEGFVEESGVQSTPLIIPRIHKGAGEVRLIESLPNLWSHIDILEASDAPHPLSQSLDSNSGNLKLGPHRKDVSSSLKSDANSEHHLMQEHPRVEDTQTSRELKSFLTNNAVEISLCKHLLYEGMGADAASQAFDAEKVDLEKFSSLGHALVKNDSLIVKIGGRYFPWDAAAPSILGMAAFGHEQIFVPEGMIAIDQVEKAIEGDPSRAIVATGGSWRLWPFTFRRARSRNYVQKALNGTKDSDAENASDNISDTVRDENVPKAKVTKRKERLKIPTSEQLASLNLKEGQNVITFTFSTAMLGKQQEEARIYLWKWNTHIVVSDVDGTITKSDVLGQFMPLVGKDWSQTGVAHLFSAIKENGYQFLFLSARAISQAYLTRQFLLNLKQDGKALPDGPVVISPDGLVPSLFREVIRRAPHEFKIACLEEIRALFPPDCNPFYAGFGNRDTDEISYLKVGIPKGKVFIINPKGEVAVNRWVDTKSYRSLHALVNGMFPAMSSAEQEDFNSWNYWRVPLPDINI